LGGDRPVSVLDFSGVPSEASDLAIGLIVRMLFEIALRSREDGIGRSRPVYIVLEEAHRYLGEAATVRMAREAVNRVAREGRKHGVGLLLVTQRPSELPETALSQVGTIIALRLTNGGDQSTVRAALPDSVSGLADALPSLRTGEAILSGESVPLPVRVVIDRPDPEPRASDPTLEGWAPPARRNDVTAAVERWRAEEGA
jgi:DNA helicase HerA-like ATPase